MKKNIITTVVLSLFIFAKLFAFEGIIEQQMLVENTGVLSNVTWFIKGDKIKLIIKAPTGESVTIIPNLNTNNVIVFNDEVKNEDGKIIYAEVKQQDISSNLGNISVGDIKNSKYNGTASKTLNVLGEKGEYNVEYLPNIDVPLKSLYGLLKESVEIQALSLKKEVGFPVNTTLIANNGTEINVLKTLSVTEKTVSDSEFVLSETGYAKYK
ncbi:MAG: hypothetical protein KDE33_15765 [Bacteroidetes bacterium]|nr:hypothetical protein [Bacteroidota bacterium]MCB9226453.1 hypothetical protein [Chitinophagales bacterium]